MLTVPEAANVVNRNPETVRRWIRSGRLRATKVGTQHVIEERDLTAAATGGDQQSLPHDLTVFPDGTPQPDWVEAIRRSRQGH